MSIEAMTCAARTKLTDEELAALDEKYQKRMAEFDRKLTDEWKCQGCGVNTLKYSHTFDCKWRGILI